SARRELPSPPPAAAKGGAPGFENLLCVLPDGSDTWWCLGTPGSNGCAGSQHQSHADLAPLGPSPIEDSACAHHFHPLVVVQRTMINCCRTKLRAQPCCSRQLSGQSRSEAEKEWWAISTTSPFS